MAITPLQAADSIQITPAQARKTLKAPPGTFTGAAFFDPQIREREHGDLSGGVVTFESGARSAWHTHPAGQLLVVLSGVGLVQEEGSRKREVRPGDVIWVPAGVKHWHGATATSAVSKFTVTTAIDGKNIDWLEPVADTQYLD